MDNLVLSPEAARSRPAEQEALTLIPGIATDGALFPIEKMAAHIQGRLHLAISIFVFRGADLLIQKRADGKYHSARLWANTCCTHPLWGEPVDQSAKRRLQEELGFTIALKPANVITYRAPVSNGLIEHEQVHVFRGELADTSLIKPTAQEVSAVRWATPATLLTAARQTPGAFAPWFRIYLERWPELGL